MFEIFYFFFESITIQTSVFKIKIPSLFYLNYEVDNFVETVDVPN